MTSLSTHEAYLYGLAQGLGAIISIFITYPLQNLVTRFQIHSLLENNVNPTPVIPALPTKPPATPPTASSDQHQNATASTNPSKLSDWEIFVKIIREEGISKLYTGVTLAMVGTAMQQGIFSYTHETLKQYYKFYNDIDVNTFINFFLGLFSGLVTTTCVNPIWVISTRLNARQKLRQMREENRPRNTAVTQEVIQKQTKGHYNIAALWQAPSVFVPLLIESLPLTPDPDNLENLDQYDNSNGDTKCVTWYLESFWASIIFSTKEFLSVVKGIFSEGIFTFWSGILLAYILTINPAIQKSTSDFLINWIRPPVLTTTQTSCGEQVITRVSSRQEDLSTRQLFFVSSASKAFATVATYPLTLLKSRLYISIQSTQQAMKDEKNTKQLAPTNGQVVPLTQQSVRASGQPMGASRDDARRNMWSEFMEVLRTDGFLGLYRGLFSKILQNSIMVVLNDYFGNLILKALRGRTHSNTKFKPT